MQGFNPLETEKASLRKKVQDLRQELVNKDWLAMERLEKLKKLQLEVDVLRDQLKHQPAYLNRSYVEQLFALVLKFNHDKETLKLQLLNVMYPIANGDREFAKRQLARVINNPEELSKWLGQQLERIVSSRGCCAIAFQNVMSNSRDSNSIKEARTLVKP
jgi:hypothetical protein